LDSVYESTPRHVAGEEYYESCDDDSRQTGDDRQSTYEIVSILDLSSTAEGEDAMFQWLVEHHDGVNHDEQVDKRHVWRAEPDSAMPAIPHQVSHIPICPHGVDNVELREANDHEEHGPKWVQTVCWCSGSGGFAQESKLRGFFAGQPRRLVVLRSRSP
jgi:hypothetical protein